MTNTQTDTFILPPEPMFEHTSPSDPSPTDGLTKQPPHPASSSDTSPLTFPEEPRMFRRFHHHGLSDSTNTTGSNDSSPTTTISTVDDSSATEPSPGSSPESPPPTTFAVGILRPRTADERHGNFFELQKQPPPRKGRNLKNLAVNTSRNPIRAASTTSLPLDAQSGLDASVLSPSFVKPPTPPRRRPSNLGLTLLTPSGTKPPPQEVKLTIPPTPAFSRLGTLRHFQSSPSLPLVPGLELSHAIRSQDFRQQALLDTILSPVEANDATSNEEEPEQNFDVPLSREEKPEAYPDGPICVYDPNIDLYLEPTADQARQYDVIMNVASEVRNPFLRHYQPAPSEPDLRLDGGGGIQYAPKRSHLSTRQVDVSSAHDSSPTTPKATPVDTSFQFNDSSTKRPTDPEYIHVPWEHNSDIVPDLLRLVRVIDERVRQGNRILIHCQCGVSRSASLVVAYGLYKNPTLSVQQAYDAVKKRSKWIGPNMNLIMQLQEFRSSLERGGALSENRNMSPTTPNSALSEWSRAAVDTLSLDRTRSGLVSAAAGATMTLKPTEHLFPVTPGPSSAPSGISVPRKFYQRGRSLSAVKPAKTHNDALGPVVPAVPTLNVLHAHVASNSSEHVEHPSPVEVEALTDAQPALSSPRSEQFAMTSLLPSRDADPEDNFGIMSPTSTEFASNPFDRSTLLASLGMGSMRAYEESPRRSTSLRNRQIAQPAQQTASTWTAGSSPRRPLRVKISSPTLREQQQLQDLQAKIEATLTFRGGPDSQLSPTDDALLSPRATEFTSNPFALPLPNPTSSGSRNAGSRSAIVDPRSPAMKGQSPITRNILDVL